MILRSCIRTSKSCYGLGQHGMRAKPSYNLKTIYCTKSIENVGISELSIGEITQISDSICSVFTAYLSFVVVYLKVKVC